ncbi:MAG: hypothetical protein JZU65_19945 [Chlorobium sp.]|nr:hypothetical protein [Chlorobium sp.]
MKHLPLLEIGDNEEGFVLVTSLMIMVILILFGIFALNTTTTELRVAGNDRVAKEDFYNQESCVAKGKFQFRTWLTNAYLSTTETTAYFPAAGNDINGNGINDLSECKDPTGIVRGAYKVKNISTAGTPITTWEDIANFKNNGAVTPASHPANIVPKMAHRDKPDPVSEANMGEKGYDPKNFEIRRYVITSYSPEIGRTSVLQQGAFKVFNKY